MRTEAHKERLWSANYLLAIAVSMTVGTAISMLMTTLPIYARELGGNNTFSGLVVGIYAFSSLLCRPFVGRLLDVRGRKPVLLFGLAVLSVVFLLYGFAGGITALFLLRIVQGVGFSAHNTAVNTIAADLVPASRLSEGIGYFSISLTLPTAFGPSLGLWLIDKWNYRVLFLAAFFLALAGLVMTLFIKTGAERAEKRAPAAHAGLFEKTALPASAVMFTVALGLSGIITFVSLFGQARNIGSIGLYFTVYALALLLTRLFSGRLADNAGTAMVAVPALISMGTAFVILAFSYKLTPSLVSACFFGAGYGAVLPVMNAVVLRSCESSRKGAANATFTAVMDIGMGLGSIVWGVVSQRFGFTPVYLSCALLCVSGLALFILFHQKKKFTPPFR